MNRNTETPGGFIPFARPSIGNDEIEEVAKVLRSGWLTTGNVTLAFEKAFAGQVNADYALALNSATSGLHLALLCLKIPENSFVITTPYTFTATAEVIRYMNAHPLFVDTEEDSFNIDPHKIEEAFSRYGKKISAVLPVHVAGEPCSMGKILNSAGQYGVPVIEDAAHAFPVKTSLGFAGAIGTAGVYSFYATKTITTGEGGMLVTNDKELAQRAMKLRLHGIDRTVWDRYKTSKKNSWEYDVIAPGYKYNLTDIAAAIGTIQLKKTHDLWEKRKKIARTYIRELGDCSFLKLPSYTENHAWHLFITKIKEGVLGITRDEYVNLLIDRGIGISVHYKPLHLMSYFKEKYHFKPADFPNALLHYTSAFSLPIYPDLTEGQIQYIIETVKRIGEQYRKKFHGS